MVYSLYIVSILQHELHVKQGKFVICENGDFV